MANKKNVYPDWAEKFRAKGRTIRKVKNGYALYECTSEYVKGAAYPKAKQKYLGMITEKEGFVPKKSDAPDPIYLEYGLSIFLRMNFRREVMRHVFDFTDEIFWIGIIDFIFGDISEVYLKSSALTYADADRLTEIAGKTKRDKISRVSSVIANALENKIPDEHERNTLRNLLMLCVVEDGPFRKKPHIPEEVLTIIESHGLKYKTE